VSASPAQNAVVLTKVDEGRQLPSRTVRFKAHALVKPGHMRCVFVPLHCSVKTEVEYRSLKPLHLLLQAGPRSNELDGFRVLAIAACSVIELFHRVAAGNVRLHTELIHETRVVGSRPIKQVSRGYCSGSSAPQNLGNRIKLCTSMQPPNMDTVHQRSAEASNAACNSGHLFAQTAETQ
jgi:hypothetical protein